MRSLLAILATGLLLPACYTTRWGLQDDDDDSVADDDDSVVDDDDTAVDDDDTAVDDDDTQPDDDDTAVDDDDTTPVDPFAIDEIDPDHGSTEGGYTAEIFYTGSLANTDEDELIVRFGTAYASVLALTDEKIVVEVPPGCSPGDVSVEVLTDGDGEDDVDFEYETWADGLDGAVFGVFKAESPSVPGSEVGNIELGWFDPEVSPPLTHLPPLGSCSFNVVSPTNNRAYYSVGSSISIAASQTIPVTISPDSTYIASGLNGAVLPSNASYTIYGAVDPDDCSMPHPAVLYAPPDLVVTIPLITSQKFADCWWLDGGVGEVQWLGPYDNSARVFLTVSDPNSGASITCHTQDNGIFVVPNTYLLGLNPGALHTISITKYRVHQSIIPRSGATAHGVFVDTQTGFLFVELTAQSCGF